MATERGMENYIQWAFAKEIIGPWYCTNCGKYPDMISWTSYYTEIRRYHTYNDRHWEMAEPDECEYSHDDDSDITCDECGSDVIYYSDFDRYTLREAWIAARNANRERSEKPPLSIDQISTTRRTTHETQQVRIWGDW